MGFRGIRCIAFCLLVLSAAPLAYAYRLVYKEQLYELYHRHAANYPERIAENIVWIEQALKVDFANPLNALAVIETPREWEWYRYLFQMHLNLTMVDLYLQWTAQYTKRNARFFNAPWQRQNIASLDQAEELLQFARYYWEQAKTWSERAARFTFLHVEQIQYWEDQHLRIRTGQLDYAEIIGIHAERIAAVRADFMAMDAGTY